jgi:hypothetical protein
MREFDSPTKLRILVYFGEGSVVLSLLLFFRLLCLLSGVLLLMIVRVYDESAVSSPNLQLIAKC